MLHASDPLGSHVFHVGHNGFSQRLPASRAAGAAVTFTSRVSFLGRAGIVADGFRSRCGIMLGVSDSPSKLDYAKPNTELAPREEPGALSSWVVWPVLVIAGLGLLAVIALAIREFLLAFIAAGAHS
jgi:hypothetical protein